MDSRVPIYLDYHATTPCDPRVVESMLPTFSGQFANAASRQHGPGRAAAGLVERAREQVARLIAAEPAEIIFTSGATESDNLAIKGVALAEPSGRRHIVTSSIEHKAVLDSCQRLEETGYRVTYVDPDAGGVVRTADVESALCPDTLLVSLMYANNEIGVIQPVREVGALCRDRGILLHCDAVQALPHLDCDVEAASIDLLSISAHKMYGPKGVGALYVRRRRPRARLAPLIDGGGHERGLRSGTLNVPGIVGLGRACEIALEEREHDARRLVALRDRLESRLLEALPGAIVNGSRSGRLPNNLNISFPGVPADSLLARIPGVAASSGAACSTASFDGSYVIRRLGLRREQAVDRASLDRRALSSVRFGLGRFTSAGEIDRAADEVISAVRALRKEMARRGSAGQTAGDCPAVCADPVPDSRDRPAALEEAAGRPPEPRSERA